MHSKLGQIFGDAEKVLNSQKLPDIGMWAMNQMKTNLRMQISNPFPSAQLSKSKSNHIFLDSTPIKYTIEDYRLAKLLLNLKTVLRSIERYLIGVWIHGSLSTGDYTPYSDVDIIVIFKDQVFFDDIKILFNIKKRIREVLLHILDFDPLQHHGVFVGFESFLLRWPESYLPLEALRFSRPLWELKQPIIMRENNESAEVNKNFNSLCTQFLTPHIPTNLFNVKLLLSKFMLLPSVYLHALGNPVYKRDSFELVKSDFPDLWKPMNEATILRKQWQNPKRGIWNWMLRNLNPWLASKLYRQFEKNLPTLREYINWDHFLVDMRNLVSAMQIKINK